MFSFFSTEFVASMVLLFTPGTGFSPRPSGRHGDRQNNNHNKNSEDAEEEQSDERGEPGPHNRDGWRRGGGSNVLIWSELSFIKKKISKLFARRLVDEKR